MSSPGLGYSTSTALEGFYRHENRHMLTYRIAVIYFALAQKGSKGLVGKPRDTETHNLRVHPTPAEPHYYLNS